jgi:putative ABC transport system permease protein
VSHFADVQHSRDTFHQQLGLQIDPMAYRIKVAPGIDPESYRIALIRQESRLSVKIFDATEDNEKVAGNIRPPLYALMVALLAIGVLSLLITLLFSVRERYREFAVLKTLGFTPRQVGASVVSGSILLTGIALSIGIPLGVIVTRLSMDSIGHGIGVGKPFGFTPGPVELIILAPVILLAAILGSVIPARRAAGTTITEVLRSE